MKRALMALIAALAMAGVAGIARADGGWLDQQPPAQWNRQGMPVPVTRAATADEIGNPRCLDQVRPAETDEDRVVTDAGWYLVGGYQGGWGMIVVTGASSFDGMCRPLGYQIFVFAYGAFAGTLSPAPMDSRTDGAAGRVTISGPDRLTVQFSRYAPDDPLCCPSAQSFAEFHVDYTGDPPVVVLDSTFTQPTSR